ncbi:unnamed protein product [Polarella glacialis]|uniref:Protein kinase domain-containing protein n=1 Tax=Polarella glacialis TaxID=89957 RepID=A0A813DHW8_POLGL|nr:unnamed protein product [Polarella glacialis]
MARSEASRPPDGQALRADSKGGNTLPNYTLSQFSVLGELGAGAFGVVQKVVHQDTGHIFAMKIMDKEQVVQRGLQVQLKREVLTQLKVKHINLVRLHYYFEEETRIYCLLEFADRGQLFAYLRAEGILPEPRAASLFSDTASGLAYLHSLRIVHRDLKPENILLFGEELRAKLCDFGWCVELTEKEATRNTFCGTLEYIAPEMLMGDPHDDGIDLWALGVLLFEMLLARSPFAGRAKKETIDDICAARFELPPGSMSRGPEQLVRGLLARERVARTPLREVLRHPWVAAADRSDSGAATQISEGRQLTSKVPEVSASASQGGTSCQQSAYVGWQPTTSAAEDGLALLDTSASSGLNTASDDGVPFRVCEVVSDGPRPKVRSRRSPSSVGGGAIT